MKPLCLRKFYMCCSEEAAEEKPLLALWLEMYNLGEDISKEISYGKRVLFLSFNLDAQSYINRCKGIDCLLVKNPASLWLFKKC